MFNFCQRANFTTNKPPRNWNISRINNKSYQSPQTNITFAKRLKGWIVKEKPFRGEEIQIHPFYMQNLPQLFNNSNLFESKFPFNLVKSPFRHPSVHCTFLLVHSLLCLWSRRSGCRIYISPSTSSLTFCAPQLFYYCLCWPNKLSTWFREYSESSSSSFPFQSKTPINLFVS